MVLMLNRSRSSYSLGEQHDSKSGSDSSGGQVGCESGQNSAGVTVGGGNSSPDGLLKARDTLNRFSAFPE